MTWVKIDDSLNQNKKVRSVSLAARWTYIASICRSGATSSDGEILGCDLGLVDATPKIAKELVAAGLWETTSRGSFVVHDYLVYNRSRIQIEETKRINAENGKRGLANRYANRKANGETNRLADGLANARSVPSVLTPSEISLGDLTETETSEPPSEPLEKKVRHKPVDDDYIRELSEEFPTVNVRDVYSRATNRDTWDGYKDQRRALRDRVKWALEDQRKVNGNGHQLRTNPQSNHRLAGTSTGPERVPDMVIGD